MVLIIAPIVCLVDMLIFSLEIGQQTVVQYCTVSFESVLVWFDHYHCSQCDHQYRVRSSDDKIPYSLKLIYNESTRTNCCRIDSSILFV